MGHTLLRRGNRVTLMDKRPRSDSVVTVDCNYLTPQFAAAYLIIEGDRAAFVDNNTTRAVPLLIETVNAYGLTAEHVDFVIMTHLHLDHAGGTAALLKRCPNAMVLAHPRAARHLVDPSRLVASAKTVYGEEGFDRRFGTIEPVESARLRSMQDGETMDLGQRTLTFIHTPGHAKHHVCIHDSRSNGVFTGDAFGLAFPSLQRGAKSLVIYSSPPTDFDADEARNSVRKIAATGAERAYVTHFGEVNAVGEAADQLLRSIDSLEAILDEAVTVSPTGDARIAHCERRIREAFMDQAAQCGISLTESDWQILGPEAFLNAQGIAHAVSRKHIK